MSKKSRIIAAVLMAACTVCFAFLAVKNFTEGNTTIAILTAIASVADCVTTISHIRRIKEAKGEDECSREEK